MTSLILDDFLPTICDVANIDISTDLDGRSFLPQLKGEKGNPRDFVYCFYIRNKYDYEKAKVFARNQQYKLYKKGTFFNITDDVDEKNPLKKLTDEEKAIKAELQKVIDHYAQYKSKFYS